MKDFRKQKADFIVAGTKYKGANPEFTEVINPTTRQVSYIKTKKGVPWRRIN